MLSVVDVLVILVYLAAVTYFGLAIAGGPKSDTDYFLGGRDLPWWAVCFSIVATETSTLTVIGIPAVAYAGSLTFLQLSIGYIIGRIIVAAWFLPRYFSGKLNTAYAYLGERFGGAMQVSASVTFLVTRLLADGVRLFATAIPLKIVFQAAGLDVGYPVIIIGIGLVTIVYTFVGGLKAVVWMDVVQLAVYVVGSLIALVLLVSESSGVMMQTAIDAGKLTVFDFRSAFRWPSLITENYNALAAIVGGAALSMASHGTDQLIVQRVLACRSESEGRKALIVSGFAVAIQFALFLAVGLFLWMHYDGASTGSLGLGRGDEIFPYFILNEMPVGLKGLLIAGIIAAAMSTLSSSLNALASSSVHDLMHRGRRSQSGTDSARSGKVLTVFWGLVFIVFASLFTDRQSPVVELGLAIASYTYGGLLGAFLLGLLIEKADQVDAIVSFFVALVVMVFVIKFVLVSPEGSLVFAFGTENVALRSSGFLPVAWPWYTIIGTLVLLSVGSMLSFRHR